MIRMLGELTASTLDSFKTSTMLHCTEPFMCPDMTEILLKKNVKPHSISSRPVVANSNDIYSQPNNEEIGIRHNITVCSNSRFRLPL